MEPQALIGFLIIAATLSLTPGPDWAFAISAGLGHRNFAPAVAGLCSGYILHTALLAAGIAALMTAMPALLLWITVVGALYLLWLGFTTSKSWRQAGIVMVGPAGELPQSGAPAGTVPAPGATPASHHTGSPWGPFLQGFGTSAINPKGMLFFVALTPQFVRPNAAFSVPAQSAVLGLSFVVLTAIVYTLVAAGSRRLLASRPGAARGVTLSSGIIMSALGAALLVEQIGPMTAAAAGLFTRL